MSDTTNVQVYVYDCPEDQRAAVASVLWRHNLEPGWDTDRDAIEPAPLELGEVYGSNYANGDASEWIANDLIEQAPGATFQTWTDPAYDWLGSGVIYTPELGRFDYESTADGEPVFTQEQVLQAMAADNTERALGIPWTRAIRES